MATRQVPLALDHPTVVPRGGDGDASPPVERTEDSRWAELTQ